MHIQERTADLEPRKQLSVSYWGIGKGLRCERVVGGSDADVTVDAGSVGLFLILSRRLPYL